MGMVKKVFGVALIVLGIAGLFLPLLQGIILIIAGIYLLEFEVINSFIKSKIKKWKKRRKR